MKRKKKKNDGYGVTNFEKLHRKIVRLSTLDLLEIINSNIEGEYDIIEKDIAKEEISRREKNANKT